MKTLTARFTCMLGILICMTHGYLMAQLTLRDDYDGVGNLAYTAEDATYWVITGGVYEARTGGVTTPNHSYASYDMSSLVSGWDLQNTAVNEWCGWMDLNRGSASGWGGSEYSCGMVLAADNADFNAATTTGYAVGIKDDDVLVLFKFSQGIHDGATSLPQGATEIVATSYSYSNSDNGVNIYVKLEADGKWTVKWIKGVQLSTANAVLASSYTDGSVTSGSADNTYRGTSFKYAGWIYSHSTGASDKSFLDNFGFGQDAAWPVELTSFVASLKSNQVTLNWRTATEVNNYGFDVEKSYDQKFWSAIGFVGGHGTVNTEQQYRFVDQLSPTDQLVPVISYRLKQIDRGGSVEYSPIVSVTQKPSFKNVTLHQNFPNPFNPSTNISFSLPSEQKVSILIYDLLGNEIMRLLNKAPMSAGSHSVSFDAQGLTSGTYLYKIQTEHISLTKRMTLMK